MDLFDTEGTATPPGTYASHVPLAVRMRPEALKDFSGQEHLLAEGKLLWRAIRSDRMTSAIFYGPPGTGKTSLAFLISKETRARFHTLNAASNNIADLRKAIEDAKRNFDVKKQKTILFIDEIHRFNKAQQDVLMPDVEQGNPVLIGATTQNPFFSILPALVSRSLIFQLKPLAPTDVLRILERALSDPRKGLGDRGVRADGEALEMIARLCDGDARRALNALELAVLTTPPRPEGEVRITTEIVSESMQKKAVVYDRDGDNHYDTASAFIKSMRGSDPDAAIYYLAKMLYAGEDARFIARRIVIAAAEDVGNADPQAIVVANAALQISEFIGLPEARIPLAQAAIYVACAPKSNASYMALENATKDLETEQTLEVPKHLKDASYKGASSLGHGQGYQYAHDGDHHYVKQDYLASPKKFYFPTDIGHEKIIRKYLDFLKSK